MAKQDVQAIMDMVVPRINDCTIAMPDVHSSEDKPALNASINIEAMLPPKIAKVVRNYVLQIVGSNCFRAGSSYENAVPVSVLGTVVQLQLVDFPVDQMQGS